MVVLAVTWMANPGKENEVADVFSRLQEAARSEPGCLMFIVHQHRSESGRFFVYEQYRDDDALQQHRQTSHFQEYVVKILPTIGERRQGDLYVPIAERSST
jgi:quinol monooxygenase YgiN